MTSPPDDLEDLRLVAVTALANAFAPFSTFRVGAALRTRAGNVYRGCNVETANYSLGICAERTAVVSAVAAEGPTMEVEEIVIVTGGGHQATPCGSCRQVLYEFGHGCRITLIGDEGITALSIAELLPRPFGREDLPLPSAP